MSIRDVIRNTQLRGQISRSKEIEKTISRDLESSVGLKDGLIEKKVKEVVMEAVGKKFFSHGGSVMTSYTYSLNLEDFLNYISRTRRYQFCPDCFSEKIIHSKTKF